MLPAVAFRTDQAGTITTMFPFASLPTAVNCCVPPVERVLVLGLTVIVASAPTPTFTVAKPEMPPLAACTVLLYVPDTVPAVKTPVPLLMLPAVAFRTDQDGTITTMFPFASLPTAVKVCVPPVARLLVLGLTVIDAKAPGSTVIDALAGALPTGATPVGANGPGVVPALKTPARAPVPPPAATVQVGETQQ